MPYNLLSFENLFEKMLGVKSWLESIGIKRLDETRIPEIIDCIKFLDTEHKKYQRGENNRLKELGEKSNAAVIEAISLNTIKEGLSRFNKSHLPREALKQCLRGTFSSLDESKDDNNARNRLYELELGSYLLLQDISVTQFEDINFNVNKYKIAIQCKRPLSAERLEDNIEKAVRQLKKRNHVNDDKNSFGFVAISLEKICKLDRMRIFKNRDELNSLIFQLQEKTFERIELFWKKKRSTKIFGLIFSFKTIAVFEDTKQLQGVNISIFRYRVPQHSSPRRDIINYVKPKLHSQIYTF